MDIRQTNEWAKYLTELGWKVIKLDGNYIHIRKLPFNFSYIKIPRPTFPLDLNKVDQIAHQYHALLVKITPNVRLDDLISSKIHAQLKKAGYIKDYWTKTVTKSMVIDLTKSEGELFKSFHPKTRQYINLAKRNGVKITQSDDINLCYRLYLQTAKRNNFKPQSFKDINSRFLAFNSAQRVLLFFAQAPDNKYIATLLLLINPSGELAFCSLAATSDTHRYLRASSLIHWEAMLFAKKFGCQKFDFDGIYDQNYRATYSWSGFTFFKKGFNGQEISFLGSYIKLFNPIKFWG